MDEPIAIIGTGCRFPGDANSPSRLWKLLQNPVDLHEQIPPDRFNAQGFYNTNGQYHGNSNVAHSYFLKESVGRFDPKFFSINPVEAAAIDPQQRLLLETVYEGLEASGHSMDQLRNSDTAVYVGIMRADYEVMMMRDRDTLPLYHSTGTAKSIVSNRLSYVFGWHGPSMTIDTACSSSLIAVHQAVQLLRQGDSKIAIAAGTNLILGPDAYVSDSKLRMLSPTGRSRMWDAAADGYARGEGVAALVLKRLSDAVADGDPIECVIRQTGTNQDGRTNGITMPSPTAQTMLIRQVYDKAGLDPRQPDQRCQYFECHGTGTLAGDPVEAEAIYEAFFGDATEAKNNSSDTPSCLSPLPSSTTPLYVGSIKTVIGHTEGTAGVAGIIKACQALKHAIIPPNLLFDNLNPKIEPFYHKLHLPTKSIPWPQVPDGQPRRASVNSFGFGGSNAHALLESYEPKSKQNSVHSASKVSSNSSDRDVVAPFVLSASSQQSLKLLMAKYARYLAETPTVSLRDLTRTLYEKRSILPIRVHFTASSVDDLMSQLVKAAEQSAPAIGLEFTTHKAQFSSPKILGVFTGQGAQWAAMGRDLLRYSSFALNRMTCLHKCLDELREPDRPTWSLVDTLLEGHDLGSAHLSQPVCTAIQLLLVDILETAGVRFDAVVGHSSGEIAAAYAAGYISASDAYKIAYYRGKHTGLAAGTKGQPGRMMAVMTSHEFAQQLCSTSQFSGRVCVAAVNSPDSITLSGDQDAILEAKEVLEEQGTVAKLLFVDRAYHSHHMLKCAKKYRESLQSFDPRFKSGGNGHTLWFSSVYKKEVSAIPEKMNSEYWNANLIGTVFFADAVACAMQQAGPVDVAVEVGPHPALKRPAMDSNKQATGKSDLLYTGILRRSENDLDALSAGLGFLWTILGNSMVNLSAFETLLSGARPHETLQGLPTYSWDNEKEYWHESRISRQNRIEKSPTHQLLGNLQSLDGAEATQMRWRNFLSTKEVPWLDGHQIQEQTIFPAAGYVVMALEAADVLLKTRGLTATVLEVNHISIHSAMAMPKDDSVETLFTLSEISLDQDNPLLIHANFSLNAAPSKMSESLPRKASGRIRIMVEDEDVTGNDKEIGSLLSRRSEAPPRMISVARDKFYSSLSQLGYGYVSPFQAMDDMSRRAGYGSGTIVNYTGDATKPFLIHPATLDTAIQALLLAHCYPGDGDLTAIHVPTYIGSVRIEPTLCAQHLSQNELPLSFDSVKTQQDRSGFVGDVDVFTADGNRDSQMGLIQMQDIRCVPLVALGEEDDVQLFSTTKWALDVPDAVAACYDMQTTDEEHIMASDLERLCLFYFNQWGSKTVDSTASSDDIIVGRLMRLREHTLSQVSSGQHPYANKEWMHDTVATIDKIRKKYIHTVDLRMIEAVGTNMPAVMRGESLMTEQIMENDLFRKYYEATVSLSTCTKQLARITAQLCHRYPHMDILELGAGTGRITEAVLETVDSKFRSYYFTDKSANTVDLASDKFKQYTDNMKFGTLDLAQDVASQGYGTAKFDLVVISFAFHTTASLQNALANARKLIKPGGYLLLMDFVSSPSIRTMFTFGALPEWWAGEEDGRLLSSYIDEDAWDALLRKSGFSGVESITNHSELLPHSPSILVSQAEDGDLELLRNPLTKSTASASPLNSSIYDLIIIGGQTPVTEQLTREIISLIHHQYTEVDQYLSLGHVPRGKVGRKTTVINLADVDSPVFEVMDKENLSGLQDVYENAKCILWFTEGCREKRPHANMSVGYGRALRWEVAGLQIQFIDVDSVECLSANRICSALLRFEIANDWQVTGKLASMLYTIEPELVWTEHATLVPRVMACHRRNRRHNACRRDITEPANIAMDCVEAAYREGQIILQKDTHRVQLPLSEDIRINVRYSSTSSIAISRRTKAFVVCGQNASTGETVVGYSERNASTVTLDKQQCIAASDDGSGSATYMAALLDSLIAQSLLCDLDEGSSLLVHDASIGLRNIIRHLSSEKNIDLFVTTSDRAQSGKQSLYIDPRLPLREVRDLLSKSSSHDKLISYVDCSSTALGKDASELIEQCINARHGKVHLSSLYQTQAYIGKSLIEASQLSTALHTAAARATQMMEKGATDNNYQVVSASVLSGYVQQKQYRSILDWQRDDSMAQLSVNVQPVEATLRFSPNRTYWLVGLTGDLGLSLCEWMIQLGAKYVVLSSRNPKIDSNWIEHMSQKGGAVTVMANDVTNKADTQRCYNDIVAKLPPIGGVAQGAMVLRDTTAFGMDLETMQTVLAPKVQGSRNLDAILHDTPLEFFVYFSSITGVVGNLGQSNYAAANAYMMSLSAQRRMRGLASSVINIGPILGVGYVTREMSNVQQDAMYKGGFRPMSEQAFLHTFAEGVIAGTKFDESADIITGLLHIHSSDQHKPLWLDDPRFSHHVIKADSNVATTDAKSSQDKTASFKAQLLHAESQDQVSEIVKTALLDKLHILLEIPRDDTIDDAVQLARRTDQLGVDSLTAVEIRSWFIKTMQVNIPMLQILGGASIGDIILVAANNLEPTLVPKLYRQPESAAPTTSQGSSETSQATPTHLLTSSGAETPVSEASVDNDGDHAQRSPA